VQTWPAKVAARRKLKTRTAVADRILMILSVEATAQRRSLAQGSQLHKRLAEGWTAGADASLPRVEATKSRLALAADCKMSKCKRHCRICAVFPLAGSQARAATP